MSQSALDQSQSVPLLDPAHLRRVYAAFPTGVTAVAGLVDDAPTGFTASSFTSVSVDPPLVSFCVAHTSTTWPRLRRAERLGISVLAAAQHGVGRRLASRGTDRFAGLGWYATPGGAVLLHGAAAWLETGILKSLSAGDHDIVVLTVHALDLHRGVDPLVFHASRFGTVGPAA
ncbi:MAG TPA: flavin reductase family protein [Actinocrinis sp.]|jgi:flavin reductase (DIM6/NTAB) family NADH-FMN oxidoreductase RutF